MISPVASLAKVREDTYVEEEVTVMKYKVVDSSGKRLIRPSLTKFEADQTALNFRRGGLSALVQEDK